MVCGIITLTLALSKQGFCSPFFIGPPPFQLEETFLPFPASGKPAQTSRLGKNPVAGNDKGETVPMKDLTHIAGGPGPPGLKRQKLITPRLSGRNVPQSFQHPAFKAPITGPINGKVPEIDKFSMEISPNHPGGLPQEGRHPQKISPPSEAAPVERVKPSPGGSQAKKSKPGPKPVYVKFRGSHFS